MVWMPTARARCVRPRLFRHPGGLTLHLNSPIPHTAYSGVYPRCFDTPAHINMPTRPSPLRASLLTTASVCFAFAPQDGSTALHLAVKNGGPPPAAGGMHGAPLAAGGAFGGSPSLGFGARAAAGTGSMFGAPAAGAAAPAFGSPAAAASPFGAPAAGGLRPHPLALNLSFKRRSPRTLLAKLWHVTNTNPTPNSNPQPNR